jgi:predicted RNA-binding Zn-ribbon protein involved in translation (DUF1610 family)
MAMDLIAGAATSIKMVKDTISALLDLKVDIETRAKIADALAKLGDAQDAVFMLRETLFELQRENESLRQVIAKHDDWKKRVDPYKLAQTAGGAVVYRNAGGDGVPEHFACPTCVNKREIQILQDRRTFTGDFDCPSCKTKYPIKPNSGSVPFA